MRPLRFLSLLTLLSLLGVAAQAQLRMEYFDNAENVSIFQNEVFAATIFSGVEFLPGDKIETRDSSVEILSPDDRSIFLLEANSSLLVESIEGVSESLVTSLSLQYGSLRAIVANTDHPPLRVHTHDHTVEIMSGELLIASSPNDGAPRDAIVQVSNLSTITSQTSESTILLSKGQTLSLQDNQYRVEEAPEEYLFSTLNALPFKWLDPMQVPGYRDPFPNRIAQLVDEALVDEANLDEAAGPEEPVAVNTEEGEDYRDIYPHEEYDFRPFSVETSAGFLVLGDRIYGHFVLSPSLIYDNFSLTLHLPIIVRGTLETPENWYRPSGNFTWSFGSDYDWNTEMLDATFDLINDILLKTEITINDPESSFYLRVGQLHDISFGESMAVQGFSNSPFFPQRERAGIYFSTDWGIAGWQTFAEEVSHKALYGTRIYFRTQQEKKAGQIGISMLLDRGLGKVLHSTDIEGNAIPHFGTFEEHEKVGYIIPGFDMFVPMLDPSRPLFAFLFSGNILLPYKDNFALGIGSIIDPEFNLPVSLFTEIGLGGEAQYGERLVFDYRASFRYYGSLALSEYANTYLDQSRLTLMQMLRSKIENTLDTSVMTFAVGTKLGFLVDEVTYFGISYHFPLAYSLRSGETTIGNRDALSAEFSLTPKNLPFSIEASFRFQDFISLVQGHTEFFSDSLSLDGSIALQAGKFVEFTMSSGLILLEDSEGNLQLSNDGHAVVGGRFSLLATLRL